MRQSGGLLISDSPPFVIRFALRMCVRLPSEANNRKIETFDLNLTNFSYSAISPHCTEKTIDFELFIRSIS